MTVCKLMNSSANEMKPYQRAIALTALALAARRACKHGLRKIRQSHPYVSAKEPSPAR